ncbi:PH domain-containing protein [Streptomyces sp. RFCAC02]|uniref:PH domain-containing protein n=1 Tax=Streptomyces sp. RFCAC02 TaxID=2499143 RepID=UPI001021B46C|nr:PH domain-containing protein [Streptomyces sp. RFCAC02]
MTAPGPRQAVPALPVTFRPTVTRAVLLTIGVAVLLALTLVAVLLPQEGAVSWGWGDRSAFIGCGLLVLAGTVLLSRPRVTADRDGVTVVNLTTTRRLAWAQVLRVTLRPGDPWAGLDLADGTTLPVMAIQPGVSRARALSDARALRALVESGGAREASGQG